MSFDDLRNDVIEWLEILERHQAWLAETMLTWQRDNKVAPYTRGTLKKYVSNFLNPDLRWVPRGGWESPFMQALLAVKRAQERGKLHARSAREDTAARATDDDAALELLPEFVLASARELIDERGAGRALRRDGLFFGLARTDSEQEDRIRLATLFFYIECPNRIMEALLAGGSIEADEQDLLRAQHRADLVARLPRSARCPEPHVAGVERALACRAAMARLLCAGVAIRLHGPATACANATDTEAMLEALGDVLDLAHASREELDTILEEARFAVGLASSLARLLRGHPLGDEVVDTLTAAAATWPRDMLEQIARTRPLGPLDHMLTDERLLAAVLGS